MLIIIFIFIFIFIGRYYILNAIVNQLRYPNSHTQYFSSLLLKLFIDAEEEIIQEQITRLIIIINIYLLMNIKNHKTK